MEFLASAILIEQPYMLVEKVAQHLVGVMDTPAVTMTTCRIQVEQPADGNGSIYLYQEQAMSKELTKPYRQRILELTYRPLSQTVRSRSFRLRQSESQVNFCDRGDRILQLSDFPEVVCSVFLKENSQGFAGTTPADGCPTQARGAALIRNRIDLHGLGMDTWDRGFDAKGQQIWGAKTEAYKFRWKRKG
jgi:hypothetical protein